MAEKRDLTRRDVVKAAGAATVAAAAVHAQRAPFIQKVKAANNQVQYGFIGTGSRGQYLLKHLKTIEDGRCVAVCDIDQAAMEKAAALVPTGKPAMHKDYRELLARKDVDAVLIAVPLFAHFPITRDGLLAGKHVFCEKSLVFKPEEVHALRQLAHERPKQILQVGLQRRYSQYYQTVKQMVDKGVLGNVTHIHAQWHRNPGWVMKSKDRLKNWRLFREYSGGLTAELASHQIDVADWMFGSTPEYVIGVGSLDTWKDGRDIYDNIQLIYKYPKNQKLVYTAISTNQHLPLFNAGRTEFGELIMGTGGAVHITVGSDNEPATAIWYPEPKKAQVTQTTAQPPAVAGATMVSATATQSLPVLLDKERVTGKESFIEKEMKFARLWLYKKGVIVPEEPKNPVDTELISFLNDVRNGSRPKADVEVGLMDSTAVMLSNLCMDEQRRVYFSEIDKLGRAPAPPAKAAAKKT